MLETSLIQIESLEAYDDTVANSEKLIICAGRWGPMCIPVYGIMEKLQKKKEYKDINFRAMVFDNPATEKLRKLDECRSFRGLPFTVYYRDGIVVHATSSIQTREQLEENIEKYLK